MPVTTHTVEWWRPESPAEAEPATGWQGADREQVGGRLAFAALITFTVILFVAPQERIPALAALRIALVAAGTAFVSYWADRILSAREAPAPARENRIALLLLIWAAATIPFSLWPGGSVETLLDLYLKSLLVFWLLGATLITVPRLRFMAWTLSLATLPLATTAIMNYAGGVYEDGRISGYQGGIAHNPNDLALTLNIILPLTVALAATARHLSTRLAAAALVALNAVGVIVTFSRGGFLTLIVIAIFTSVAFLGRRALVGVAALGFVLLIGLPLMPSGYSERLATITDVESDPTGSAQDRWRDTVAAVRYIGSHPITGAGLGQDVLALNELRGDSWKNVHNIYLQYGADLGVLGMGLFIALMVIAIRGAARVEREGRDDAHPERRELARLAGAVRIGLIAFAVAGVFHPVAYYFYFYYLAGLSVAVQRAARMSV